MSEGARTSAGAIHPTVLIYKKRVLGQTETFIATQALSLRRYRPVFAGLEERAGGLALLNGVPRYLLEQHHPFLTLGRWQLERLGTPPARWLRAIAAEHPVLVHVHFGSQAPAGIALARALGVPAMVAWHGTDACERPKSRAQAARRQRAFADADHHLANSTFIAESLRSQGCPPDRISINRIGLDTDRYTPGNGPRASSEVLFVGRLVELKGASALIRAMMIVQREMPDASLVIAGDGPLRAELEGQATAAGVRVRFIGGQSRDQVVRLMREATVFCVPSVSLPNGIAEGLGIAFLEAQSCGLPVVSTLSGGIPEAVRHGETGLLSVPGDAEALATNLVTVLRDASLRERMGAAGRAFVVEHFAMAVQGRALDSVYDHVVARGVVGR